MLSKDEQIKFRKLYYRWLRAAYFYYHRDCSLMEDAEWDAIARHLFENREKLPEKLYPILHTPGYSGGSLFWVTDSQYPSFLKIEDPSPEEQQLVPPTVTFV